MKNGKGLIRRICALSLALMLLLPALRGAAEEKTVPAPDFTLTDQYGNTHTLSDYQGKVVFLNFWATWCAWCIKEMPDIEALYHELGENAEEVVFLGMAAPGTLDTADEAGVSAFLAEHEFTYPVLMDPTGDQFSIYSVSAYPTTWLIRKDGTLMGYVAGALSREDMTKLIQMTLEESQETAEE